MHMNAKREREREREMNMSMHRHTQSSHASVCLFLTELVYHLRLIVIDRHRLLNRYGLHNKGMQDPGTQLGMSVLYVCMCMNACIYECMNV